MVSTNGAGGSPAFDSRERERATEMVLNRRKRLRASNGRFVAPQWAEDDSAFGELLSRAQMEDVGDLGDQDDSGVNCGVALGAQGERWTKDACVVRSIGAASAFGGVAFPAGPIKSSYLAHRIETLWQEAASEARGQGGRLDSLMPWQEHSENGRSAVAALAPKDAAERVDDRITLEDDCARLELYLGIRASDAQGREPACLSCGVCLNDSGKRLCSPCEAAENSARSWSLHGATSIEPRHVPLRPNRSLDDSFRSFETLSRALRTDRPVDRDKKVRVDHKRNVAPDERDWRGLFWLLVLLVACAGIVACIYDA